MLQQSYYMQARWHYNHILVKCAGTIYDPTSVRFLSVDRVNLNCTKSRKYPAA